MSKDANGTVAGRVEPDSTCPNCGASQWGGKVPPRDLTSKSFAAMRKRLRKRMDKWLPLCRNCRWWGEPAGPTLPSAPHAIEAMRRCKNPKNDDTCPDEDSGHIHHSGGDFGCIHFEAKTQGGGT